MFDLVDIWARRTGNRVRLVSANDHVHARGSAHYAGLALDLISTDPDRLASVLRQIGYRVLWRVPGHYGHLHVQESRAPLPPDARAAGRHAPPASWQPPPTAVADAGLARADAP